jgi:hypothetical protein
MKKNLYYHTVFKRTNTIKMFILGFFLGICSWPRVFIEVFTRRNFGERYFLFPLCVLLAVILAAIPFGRSYGESAIIVIGANFTWYAYIVAFVMFSLKRRLEVRREPGAYDFAKFSLSAGVLHPQLRYLSRFGINLSNRVIATYVEPGIFLIAGVFLIILKQDIGYVLSASAVIYGFSWAAQYYLGDQFILDKIDEMISNEELVESFVHNRDPEETRGFEVYGDRPSNQDFRRKIVDQMFEEEPAVDVL